LPRRDSLPLADKPIGRLTTKLLARPRATSVVGVVVTFVGLADLQMTRTHRPGMATSTSR
jgi:hypothetical protein